MATTEELRALLAPTRPAPTPVEEPPLTEAEIARGSTPATGLYDRTGRMKGFYEPQTGNVIPRSAVPPPVDPTRGVELKRGTGDTAEEIAAMSGKAVPNVPGTAVSAAVTPPSQPKGIDVQDYTSVAPKSQYDDDLELTDKLANGYGMVGLHKLASGTRELHMALQAKRMGDVTANAQRAFVAGDITKAIDVFNHAVPNGRQITGYALNPDKTYTLKHSDGSTENRTPAQIAEGLATFADPHVMSTMMVNRAKSLADLQKEMFVNRDKGRMSMEQAIAKGFMDSDRAMRLAEYNRTHGKGTTHVDMANNVYIDKPDGRTVKVIEEKSPLDPKRMVYREVEISGAPAGPQASQPRASAPIDLARIMRAVGQPGE